jgi:FkbM family methyltransferase
MFVKEPETTEWILRLKKDDILWDIGACVGTYTIMAGTLTDASVFAFEPSYANVNNLNSNIVLNNLEEKCKAYSCAISDVTGFNILNYIMHDSPGISDNQLDEARSFKQGTLTYSIDDLVSIGIPHPTHIKIDVDGIESKILKGGMKTFKNVKSILVEMKYLNRCDDKEKQVNAAH